MSDNEERPEEPQAVGEKVEQLAEEPEGAAASASPSQEEQKTSESESESSSKQNGEETPPAQPTADVVASPVVRVKHDWFQTQSDVYLDLMVKRLRREDVHVQFSRSAVKVNLVLPSGEEYDNEFILSHPIVLTKSSYKVLGTKVELKMKKTAAQQWDSLERGSDTTPKPKHIQPQATDTQRDDSTVHKYPSSSHYTRDWDKLVATVKKEEKDEKLEGDAALNKLFQQIYADGSDEVRKAMNKSFVESGGTVLSTNWKEVGEKPVERKPPDGMEWKDYDL